MLNCIENGVKPELDIFPAWLHRLVAASVLDAYKLRGLRQLLLFCYKAYTQHDNKSKTQAAFSSFESVNREVKDFGNSFAKSLPVLLDLARKYVESVLFEGDRCFQSIVPSHGPGAVTTSKEAWQNWYPTIDAVYPLSDYLCLYANRDAQSELGTCEWHEDIVAKLIAVPKDSRGPRLICVHPAEAIWIQQGLRVQLERAITRTRYHRGIWPRGRINFDDQTVNGRIALTSSRSRLYATLDMKEASDRVSDILVQYLFGRYYKYFGCCRAQKYYVGEAGIDQPADNNIHSYAPMGNATTFPVESLVFWAICCASLQHHGFHQPGAVFVFGDDIIVPSRMAPIVINDLESFGLVVNRSKSFYKGGFRESCGVDAFNGINVTPIRWKSDYNAEHLSGLQSLSDLAMRFRIAGYEGAASTAYSHLRRRLQRDYRRELFFTNNPHHGGLAEYTTQHSRVWADAYWHKSIQWFVSPVGRVEQITPKRVSVGWLQVLESICGLTANGRSSIPDRTVSRRSRLNRGWINVL